MLRGQILAGSLPDGLLLSETEVGRFFGVSRAPASHALGRLSDEGLIYKHAGRGYILGGRTTAKLRLSLKEAGLHVPPDIAVQLGFRNQRDRIYPNIERTIASTLALGLFQIAESDLAEHFHVSRTIAREILTQLLRVGLVEQQRNGRWTTATLSMQGIHDHYEVRILLEPVALVQAASAINSSVLKRVDRTIKRAATNIENLGPAEMMQLERDLHHDIVLRCTNAAMRDAIHRSQLPLIATHITFADTRNFQDTHRVIVEHGTIVKALIQGRFEAAAAALKQHLVSAMETSERRLKALGDSATQKLPSFLKPV
jgi:DNA-binding GntR family transcriptional regulator